MTATLTDSDVRYWEKALVSHCRRITNDPWQAEDLVQDTWIKVLQHAPSTWKSVSHPQAYLLRMATHTWIDQYRKARRRPQTVSLDTKEWELMSDAQAADWVELDPAIRAVVGALPVRQSLVYMWVEGFGYRLTDLAQRLGMSEGSIKALLHRARKNLARSRHAKMDGAVVDGAETRSAGEVDEKVVELYLRAVQENDPSALMALWNDNATQRDTPVLRRLPDAGVERQVRSADVAESLAWSTPDREPRSRQASDQQRVGTPCLMKLHLHAA